MQDSEVPQGVWEEAKSRASDVLSSWEFRAVDLLSGAFFGAFGVSRAHPDAVVNYARGFVFLVAGFAVPVIAVYVGQWFRTLFSQRAIAIEKAGDARQALELERAQHRDAVAAQERTEQKVLRGVLVQLSEELEEVLAYAKRATTDEADWQQELLVFASPSMFSGDTYVDRIAQWEGLEELYSVIKRAYRDLRQLATYAGSVADHARHGDKAPGRLPPPPIRHQELLDSLEDKARTAQRLLGEALERVHGPTV